MKGNRWVRRLRSVQTAGRFRSIAASIAISALVLSACTSGGGEGPTTSSDGVTSTSASSTSIQEPDTTTPEGKTELVVALAAQPLSLDPAYGNPGIYALDLAYAPLLDVDVSGEIVGVLATEWGYTDDENREFSLTLREDAQFSDGSPVTAQAVADSFEYFKTGASAYTAAFSDLSAEASAEWTVTIHSATPNPIIPELLTPFYLAGLPIAPAGVANPDVLATNTIGAGPYVLDPDATAVGESYVYVPNEYYFDQDAIHWEKVTVIVIENAASRVQALNTGQIDVMAGTPNELPALDTDTSTALITPPSWWNGLFIVDIGGTAAPALGDVRVRQAINYAIDREAIIEGIYDGYAIVTNQPNSPGWDAWDESLNDTYPFDQEEARRLLAEAGYGDGLTLNVNYAAVSADQEPLLQAIAAQLAEVGITLNLRGSGDEYVSDLYSLEYPITSVGFGGQPLMLNAAQIWADGAILNPYEFEYPALRAALEEAYSASPEEAVAKAQDAQALIVEEAYTVPVAAIQGMVFRSNSVAGLEFTPTGRETSIVTWYPAN